MAQDTVFGQLIKLVPRTEFQSFVTKHDGDRGVRSLDCWTWFGSLLFGQMTGHDSIRAIERVFAHADTKMKKLGFGPVRRSTLADANAKRPIGVLEDVFFSLLKRAKQIAPKHNFGFIGEILALDSTTIDLCLSLSPWARYRSGDAAVKLHTAIDVASELPEIVVMTPGAAHDLSVARKMNFKKGTTVVCDRIYVGFDWLSSLNQSGVFFVSRTRKKLHFKVAKCTPTDRTLGHMCDQEIYINGRGTKGKYKGKLRRISFRDPDTKKHLVFITNRFDLPTKTICDLYKARWKVELFFKAMKQYLRIRKFLGNSANAVKAQIWVALIGYVLVQLWKFSLRSSISTPDAMAALGVLLLLREPVARILGQLPRITRHPQASQLVLNL